jgi:glycosyltransferase involved in cell wall biosynthesis
MHREVLPQVIFSPGALALQLADGLVEAGHEVTLFTPGPVATRARNSTADLSYLEAELAGRGDSYADLLRKHPFTFITLARQVQAELIATAYAMANANELDVVHIYTNEEELALPFAQLCRKPVVFTHHDPFNFLVKYKNLFPKYSHLNWISLSYAQRLSMPPSTNWLANIYHGLPENDLTPLASPHNDYVAYLGRIIEPKGAHLAIAAVEQYNRHHPATPLTLKVAGKHYSGTRKDTYWQEQVRPRFSRYIIDAGYVPADHRQQFLGNARALLVPSIFAEPFGMVVIEALACGTPVIGLDSGAIPELLTDKTIGTVVPKAFASDGTLDEVQTVRALSDALGRLSQFDRAACRRAFAAHFTAQRMCQEYLAAYRKLTGSPGRL